MIFNFALGDWGIEPGGGVLKTSQEKNLRSRTTQQLPTLTNGAPEMVAVRPNQSLQKRLKRENSRKC
jgi:hypothetical protein